MKTTDDGSGPQRFEAATLDEQALIAVLGSELTAYLLAMAPNGDAPRLDANVTDREEIQARLAGQLLEIADLIGRPEGSVNHLQWSAFLGGVAAGATISAGQAVRQSVGGRIYALAATHDDVERTLISLAENVYPILLLPAEHVDPFRSMNIGVPLYRNPGQAQFIASVLADRQLSTMFTGQSEGDGFGDRTTSADPINVIASVM